MDQKKTNQTKDYSSILLNVGLCSMLLLCLTQFVPSIRIAGYSVYVGIVFFFIVEAVSKTHGDQSGLRFGSFLVDLKKPGVLMIMLLPIISQFITPILGDYIFHGELTAHVLGRTGNILSFDKIPLLALQVIIAALGEEIAWRGFFLGKSMKKFPFWICMVVSSMLFAIAHISSGDVMLVFFDVFLVFVDSIFYSIIYKKSGNCLLSTISHILANACGIFVSLVIL